MRKTYLKRGTKELKRTPFKRKKAVKKTVKRKTLPSLSTLRNKTDALLTPLAKKLSPECECCGNETQVGHHWIEKSRSSNLRYDLRNIISLCHSCHAKIHNRFGNSIVGGIDVANVIIKQRGIAWKEQLDIDRKIEVKTDRSFYTENYNRLYAIFTNS